ARQFVGDRGVESSPRRDDDRPVGLHAQRNDEVLLEPRSRKPGRELAGRRVAQRVLRDAGLPTPDSRPPSYVPHGVFFGGSDGTESSAPGCARSMRPRTRSRMVSASASDRTMYGVTKIATSLRLRLTERRRNKAPRIGMSLRSGTPLSIVSRESPMRPAITTVCPSRMTVRVVASRVEITG